MAKHVIYTKWHWPDGVPSAEEMQDYHRGHKGQTKAEDIIWWKIDDNTHQSVIIFKSKQDADDEMKMITENRKKTSEETGHKMLEETSGPILSMLSDV